jgi:hypothetical protein
LENIMKKENDSERSSSKVTRRDFLRDGAVGAAGIVLGATGCSSFAEAGHMPEPNRSLPAEKSKVVLIREQDALDGEGKLERMLDQALLAFTGEAESEAAWARFFKPDDVIGVKINVMMTPTSPKLSRAVVRGIMQAGVNEQSIILWDRDKAGYGLQGATQREERFGYDEKSLSRIVTDKATALVNVPGMKVHWLAGIAVALKNWIGAITKINVPDIGVAYSIHGDSCAECASINAIPMIRDKCRLIIVDATRPLFHGGPQVNPKYVWPYDGIIIGTDPVAVDTVCMKILEAKRREFKNGEWPISPPPKHVFLAEEKYKLGHAHMDNIELVKLGVQEGALV